MHGLHMRYIAAMVRRSLGSRKAGSDVVRMERKPVLMPPDMIQRVEAMAKAEGCSFAEIVRRAVNAYDPEAATDADSTLAALADAVVQATAETARELERLERKLDRTHRTLKQHNVIEPESPGRTS